jgi:hypothetical protein
LTNVDAELEDRKTVVDQESHAVGGEDKLCRI